MSAPPSLHLLFSPHPQEASQPEYCPPGPGASLPFPQNSEGSALTSKKKPARETWGCCCPKSTLSYVSGHLTCESSTELPRVITQAPQLDTFLLHHCSGRNVVWGSGGAEGRGSPSHNKMKWLCDSHPDNVHACKLAALPPNGLATATFPPHCHSHKHQHQHQPALKPGTGTCSRVLEVPYTSPHSSWNESRAPAFN